MQIAVYSSTHKPLYIYLIKIMCSREGRDSSVCWGMCLDTPTPTHAHQEVKGGIGKDTRKHLREDLALYIWVVPLELCEKS